MIVLFGLALVGLLAIIAIVVDLGNARQQKRQLQSAVDSAALAGASHLSDSTLPICAAKTAAGTYAYNNLALGTFSTITTPCTSTSFTAGGVSFTIQAPYNLNGSSYDQNMMLRIDACRDVPTSFARAIGFTSTHICAHASALKTGAGSGGGGGGGGGGGTGSGDPDAPCGIDNFLPNGYFDSNSPPNAGKTTGWDPTADANHSGGLPGGSVGEGKIVGATFFATSDIDLTNNKPYFYLQNVTTGTKTTFTYAGPNNPPGFYIQAMTQVKPSNVAVNGAPPATYLYQIQWKIPSGNANNSKYTIGMGAYDKAQTGGVLGDCGKTTWSFTKGTVSSSGTCGEDAFLNTLYPSNGVASPGTTVGANYQDESPLNTNPGFQVDFRIDKGTANEIVLAAPGTGNGAPEYQLLPGPIGKEKYSTLIQYTLPASMTNGLHTVYLKAYDGDQNASGGDCGIGNWNFTLSGGKPVTSNVKLVE